MKVGHIERSRLVPNGATSVSFIVQLDLGPVRLTPQLEGDGQNRELFYVLASRLD